MLKLCDFWKKPEMPCLPSRTCFFALLLDLFHSLNDCFPAHPVLSLTILNNINQRFSQKYTEREKPTLILDFN